VDESNWPYEATSEKLLAYTEVSVSTAAPSRFKHHWVTLDVPVRSAEAVAVRVIVPLNVTPFAGATQATCGPPLLFETEIVAAVEERFEESVTTSV
jgi:hypothetical protein